MIPIVNLGQYGGDVIADAGTHAGNWFAIAMITDTIISAWAPSFTIHGVLAGITWPAGFILFGNFTSITLTSGSVVAYNADWRTN